MKQKTNTYFMFPDVLEWMEKGIEKLNKKRNELKRRLIKKAKVRKQIMEKIEDEAADITLASYMIEKRKSKQQRLKGLVKENNTRNKEYMR